MIGLENLNKPAPESAKPKVSSKIWVALMSDIDIDKFPIAVNATISSVPMKPGKFFKFIECDDTSVLPNAASAGDVVPSHEPTVAANIIGMSKPVLQFITVFSGEKFFVIWENCITRERFIAGTPCGGLRLTYTDAGTTADRTGVNLQFQGSCEAPYYYFEGNIPIENPEVVPADAVTFALSEASTYALSDNTGVTALTDITNVTDDDVNRVIDIIGYGVTNPTTIAATTKFILNGGTTFVASQGSQITFRILKIGPADYAFLELSRA